MLYEVITVRLPALQADTVFYTPYATAILASCSLKIPQIDAMKTQFFCIALNLLLFYLGGREQTSIYTAECGEGRAVSTKA